MRVQTNLLRELEAEFLPVEKQKTHWKAGLLMLLLGIVIGAGLFGLYVFLKDKPWAARFFDTGIQVETITVKGEALTEIIGVNGKTEPADTTEVTASVGGKVLSIPVEVGAVVTKDQILLQLDPAPYKAAFKGVEEKFAKAKTDFAKSELFEKRMNELFGRKLITSTELEKATRELNKARVHFSDTAEALLIAQDNLAKTVITSKAPGIIMDRRIQPGDIVNTKDSLFLMGTTESVQVAISIPKEKGDRIVVGQEADIVLDAYPNMTLTGQVEKIDTIVTPAVESGTLAGHVAPPADKLAVQQMNIFIRIKSELKIKTGLPAFAWIKSHRKGLMIPRFSVIQPIAGAPIAGGPASAGQSAVFVVENMRAHKQPIRAGVTRKNKIEVLEGLIEGDEVVSVGLSELQDNDRVIVKGMSK